MGLIHWVCWREIHQHSAGTQRFHYSVSSGLPMKHSLLNGFVSSRFQCYISLSLSPSPSFRLYMNVPSYTPKPRWNPRQLYFPSPPWCCNVYQHSPQEWHKCWLNKTALLSYWANTVCMVLHKTEKNCLSGPATNLSAAKHWKIDILKKVYLFGGEKQSLWFAADFVEGV